MNAQKVVRATESTGFGRGYSAEDVTNAFVTAVQQEIEESKRNGFPIARYDADKKQAYLEMPDGTREYVNK